MIKIKVQNSKSNFLNKNNKKIIQIEDLWNHSHKKQTYDYGETEKNNRI